MIACCSGVRPQPFSPSAEAVAEFAHLTSDAQIRTAAASGVNNALVINRVVAPGRVTSVRVRETIGF